MNDDTTPQHDDHAHDGAADSDPKGGPVENPAKLPDWDPESVVAEGLDEEPDEK